MAETTSVTLNVSNELLDTVMRAEKWGSTVEERIRIPLAIGLFAERAVSLGKAASLAGLSRHAFGLLLSRFGLAAVDYTEAELDDDMEFSRA